VRVTRRALILDFGGVVIKTPFEIMEPLERRLGLAPGTFAWRGPFDPARDERWRAMQHDEISERDYWALRAEEVGRVSGAMTPWSTRDLMRAFYGCSESEFVRPEAVEAIAAAADAGVIVAVLTNDLAAFHGPTWFASLAVSRSIACVVDATFTGVLKPMPGAYANILSELGLEPHEALFVDDQPRNVDGSERIGMPALHFDVTEPRASYEGVLAWFGLQLDKRRGNDASAARIVV